jgi:hypothetical protein
MSETKVYRVTVKAIVESTIYIDAKDKDEAKLKVDLLKHPDEFMKDAQFDNWITTSVLTEDEFRRHEEWLNRK